MGAASPPPVRILSSPPGCAAPRPGLRCTDPWRCSGADPLRATLSSVCSASGCAGAGKPCNAPLPRPLVLYAAPAREPLLPPGCPGAPAFFLLPWPGPCPLTAIHAPSAQTPACVSLVQGCGAVDLPKQGRGGYVPPMPGVWCRSCHHGHSIPTSPTPPPPQSGQRPPAGPESHCPCESVLFLQPSGELLQGKDCVLDVEICKLIRNFL